MKNEMKKALDRELQGVHVSSRLRARILSEAASARFPERRRRSPIPALAAAAAVLMVVALAAGMITLRRGGSNSPDPVLSQGNRGRVWICADDAAHYHAQKNCGSFLCTETMDLSDAKAQGRTACPNCIRRPATPVPTLSPTSTEEPPEAPPLTEEPPDLDPDATLAPTEAPPDVIYDENVNETIEGSTASDKGGLFVWTSEDAAFYHRDRQCSGETLDQQIPEREGIELGKQPCPVCFPNEIVWMTHGGIYFHTARNCSSMENAFMTNRTEAVTAGKVECPVCTGSNIVWSTLGGEYYHANEKCSSMENAKEISETEAILCGKVPCSTCFSELWEIHGSESSLSVSVFVAQPYLLVELQGALNPIWIEPSVIEYRPDPPFSELERLLPEDMVGDFADLLSKGEVCGAQIISYSADDLSLFRDDGEPIPENDGLSVLCAFTAVDSDTQTSAYLLSYPSDAQPDGLSLALRSYGTICTVSADSKVFAVDSLIPLNLESVTLNGAPAKSEISFSAYEDVGDVLTFESLKSAVDGMMKSHVYSDLGICISWLEAGDARFVYFTQLPSQGAQAYDSVPTSASAQFYGAQTDVPASASAQFYDAQTGKLIDASEGVCALSDGLAAYRLPDGADWSSVGVSFTLNGESQVYNYNFF